MDKEIKIIDVAPAIITKDPNWHRRKHVLKPGSIMILPDDAILYIKKEEKE